MKILDDFKKNKYVHAIGLMYKNRNDQQYVDYITNVSPDHFRLCRQSVNVLDHTSYYLIRISDDKVAGFFAMYRLILTSMLLADSLGMIPYVYITGTLYNVDGGIDGTDNLFEYYFEKTVNITIEDLLKNHNCFTFERKHSKLIDNTYFKNKYTLVNGYDVNEDYLKSLGNISKKYVKMKQSIYEDLSKSIDKILNRNGKVLGIHFRGTDYRQSHVGHPVNLEIEDYYPYIDDALNNGFNYVFVATDEQQVIEKLLNKYNDKILFYNDVFRSSNGKSIQAQTENYNGYLAAKEVLRDMMTLANCDGLIAGLSQVSICARIYKYSLNENYDILHILNHGEY